MALKIEIAITNKLNEKIESDIKAKIDHALIMINEEVVPLTPVGKSIRGRTEKNKLVRKGLARTRKGYTGGKLRQSWFIIPAQVDGDEIAGYLYNNAHYASHVNFGHRTRQGTGKGRRYKPKINGKKYVVGRFFLSRAIKKADIKF